MLSYSKKIVKTLYPYLLSFLIGLILIKYLTYNISLYENKRLANQLECYISNIALDDSSITTQYAETDDAGFTSVIRENIANTLTSDNDELEKILESDFTRQHLSYKSYLRLYGIIRQNRVLADSITNSCTPSVTYSTIVEEYGILSDVIDMEIEYLQGKRSKKRLGDWVGRDLPENTLKQNGRRQQKNDQKQ